MYSGHCPIDLLTYTYHALRFPTCVLLISPVAHIRNTIYPNMIHIEFLAFYLHCTVDVLYKFSCKQLDFCSLLAAMLHFPLLRDEHDLVRLVIRYKPSVS